MQMTATTTADILAIPDVQDSIFLNSGLTHHELVNSMRVCKAWRDIVVRYAWNQTILGAGYGHTGIPETLLATNAKWIRTLQTNRHEIVTWLLKLDEADINRLESLDFRATSNMEHYKSQLGRFLIRTKRLQHFRFHCQCWPIWCSSILEPGLINLTSTLKTLDLMRVNVNTMALNSILRQHGTNLQTLKLHHITFLPGTFDNLSCTSSLSSSPPMLEPFLSQLTTLVWIGVEASDDNRSATIEGFQQLAKFACRGVVDWTVGTKRGSVVQAISKAIKSCQSPVRSFTLQSVDGINYTDGEVAQILSSLPLESLTALELWNAGIMTSTCDTLTQLVPLTTLKSISIRQGVGRVAILIQIILAGSPSLEYLKCDPYPRLNNWAMKMTIGEGKMLPIVEWTCLGLKDLCLGFDIGYMSARVDLIDSDQEKLVLKECFDFFEQVSKLERLENLHLFLDFPQMTSQSVLKILDSEQFLEAWGLMNSCQNLVIVRVVFYAPLEWDGIAILEQEGWKMWPNLKRLILRISR